MTNDDAEHTGANLLPCNAAAQLQARFNEDVQAHYSFMDREQGYLLLRGAGSEMMQAPLMTMNVNIS